MEDVVPFFVKKVRKKCERIKKNYYLYSRNLLIIMGNLGYGAYPTHPGEVLKDEIESS